MTRIGVWAAVVVVACSSVESRGDERADPSLFDYEPVSLELLETPGNMTVGEFASSNVVLRGSPQPITGRVHRPAAEPTDTAVLLLHGSGGSAADLDDVSEVLACSGATTLAINAPNAGRGARFVSFTDDDHDEQIQLIKDLRRSGDWLLQDRGLARLGFVGVSYGAAMGSLLVGVESRIDAAALMVGDGGLVAHFTEDGLPLPEIADVADIDRWLDRMRPIEPSLFMVDAGDMPVRLVSARQDEGIPVSDAVAWHEAAGKGAEVVWVDTGHFMSPAVWDETLEWLGQHLDLDSRRVGDCLDRR